MTDIQNMTTVTPEVPIKCKYKKYSDFVSDFVVMFLENCWRLSKNLEVYPFLMGWYFIPHCVEIAVRIVDAILRFIICSKGTILDKIV